MKKKQEYNCIILFQVVLRFVLLGSTSQFFELDTLKERICAWIYHAVFLKTHN